VPLQTMCTSNSSLSLRDFVRVHLFEAAYQFVFVRAWLKKDIPMLTISFLLYITLERSVGVIC
jgi:hypothetical protein